MRKLHIATSPLTGTIFCGTPLKNGMWGKVKEDLTIEALVAVAQHGLHFGNDIIISDGDGKPEFKIIVEYVGNK